MAGNYLHTLPTHYIEPIESNLQEAAISLAEILKTGDASRWSLKIVVDNQDLIINFPVQDSREKTLVKIAEMRKRLESSIPIGSALRIKKQQTVAGFTSNGRANE